MLYVSVNSNGHVGMVRSQGGGGGGTLILSYIRRLGSFFGVQNFELQYFFMVFRKINIFWFKILWIFLGSSQTWTILRGQIYAF